MIKLRKEILDDLADKNVRAIVFNISPNMLKQKNLASIISAFTAHGFSVSLHQNREMIFIEEDLKQADVVNLFDAITDNQDSNNYKSRAATQLLVQDEYVFVANDKYLNLVA